MHTRRGSLWTAAVLLAAAPLGIALGLALWRTPVPISEAVAIFEDIARQPPTHFLTPDTSYYRPLFHMTMSAIWHNAGSLDARLAAVKLLQIVPALLLIALLVWHVRPRNALEAAVAAAAVAVLVGSPGFRDNVEIPLSYTTVGMPLALIAWMLMNAQPRRWYGPAIVALTLIAIGFKEQGLVIGAVVVAAWWTRAPGVSGRTAAATAALAAGYVLLRLSWRDSWPMFEQAIGLGFGEMEPADAVERYGNFPYFLYAYNSASTIANVLFSEPTRGTFVIVRRLAAATPAPWQLVYLASSLVTTVLIGWWGLTVVRQARREGWSPEARLAVALLVSLLACGALSFNYSRDRLGGMAVPFYAIAAFYAIRAAALRVAAAPQRTFALGSIGLVLLAGAWQTRAVGTVERTRVTAMRNQADWMVQLPARRLEFAERPTYLGIMEAMVDQGVSARAPLPTRYPPWVIGLLGAR